MLSNRVATLYGGLLTGPGPADESPWLRVTFAQGLLPSSQRSGEGKATCLHRTRLQLLMTQVFYIELSVSASKRNVAPVAYTGGLSACSQRKVVGSKESADAAFGVSSLPHGGCAQLHHYAFKAGGRISESLRWLSLTIYCPWQRKKKYFTNDLSQMILLHPHRHWLPQLHGKLGWQHQF